MRRMALKLWGGLHSRVYRFSGGMVRASREIPLVVLEPDLRA